MESEDVFERIQRGDFKNKIPYPDKNHPDLNDLLQKELEIQKQITLLQAKIEEIGWERRRKLQALRLAWGQEEAKLIGLFRKAVEEEYDMVGHPKADSLWNKAWEQGHSSGLSEVLNAYQDLVELVK